AAAEQTADGFGDSFDGFADHRFGAGDAVDHAFGDFGDAGLFERSAEHVFVDAGDRAVDRFGHRLGRLRDRRRGRGGGGRAAAAGARARGTRRGGRGRIGRAAAAGARAAGAARVGPRGRGTGAGR